MSKQSTLAKWPLIILGLTIAGLVLSGCGDATTASPTTAATPTTTTRAATAPATTSAATTTNSTTTTSALTATTAASTRTNPPTTAPATTTSPVANGLATLDLAARCYVEAVNAKNLDGLVNCFAPDGLVMDVSRPITGADAIRTWARNEVIGGTLEVQKNEAGPGRNRLLVHWSPAGSNGWQAYYTFDFKDGKITKADLQYAN